MEQLIAYLEWALDDIKADNQAIVLILDWYSAHLDELLLELVRAKTRSPALLLGGGITGLVQIPDVVVHARLQNIYKRLEAAAHQDALRLRPGKVPSWSKNDVMRRGYELAGEGFYRTVV